MISDPFNKRTSDFCLSPTMSGGAPMLSLLQSVLAPTNTINNNINNNNGSDVSATTTSAAATTAPDVADDDAGAGGVSMSGALAGVTKLTSDAVRRDESGQFALARRRARRRWRACAQVH
jgi:hypothetical protein